MRILIVRHGDPNYELDTLTEKGWREAELLSNRLEKEKIDAFYVSPLGRAKDTASLTLKKFGATAEECPWLREFSPSIKRSTPEQVSPSSWDWLPEEWTEQEIFYDRKHWYEQSTMSEGQVGKEYNWVISNFDALLAKHGYVRDEKGYYRVERSNKDTIALFCHYGLECVLLSRLMNVSPMTLWHHFFAAPTSVTTIYSEERRMGIASFRAAGMGDISHLYVGGEEPAFAGRFCEVFEDNTRHD